MYDVVNMPDLVVRYFSSTPWLIVFIVSIIYLFFRLNITRKRAMLVAVIVFFLFVNAFVIKAFTKLGQNSTYYRHLWAIPSIVVLGIAVVDFVKFVPKWYLRIPVIVALAIGLWFINGQEYIRCRAQIFSTDGTMVPEDVIELGDKLEKQREKSGKNKLFIVCPTGYERPYGNMVTELGLYNDNISVSNSSLLNDDNHNGETELLGDDPDVDYIMSRCCSKGMDYVIVSNNLTTEQLFFEKGFVPIVSTDNYNIYKCEGHPGHKQDINKWGKTSWKCWYDEKGNLINNEDGYAIVENTYDNRGRVLTQVFKNTEEEIANRRDGIAISKWKYEKGIEEVRFYDAEAKPTVKMNYGYGMIRYTLDKKGRIIEERFYNERDELINFDYKNPRAITRFTYDNEGDLVSERYYDTLDKPSKALAGYDEIRREYNNHHIVRLGYYAYGKLIDRSDTGYAEVQYIYNSEDKIEKTMYLDQYGVVVEPSS